MECKIDGIDVSYRPVSRTSPGSLVMVSAEHGSLGVAYKTKPSGEWGVTYRKDRETAVYLPCGTAATMDEAVALVKAARGIA